MNISSPAFSNNQPVPQKYTCKGPNINPPIDFSNVPEDAKSLVFLVEDVDAQDKPWVHWLVFNIPAYQTSIPEGSIPPGGVEGLANGGDPGYEGPCPIYFKGMHHYHFRAYALDAELDIPAESDKNAVFEAMKEHIVAEAEMIGLCEGTGEQAG